MKKDDMVLIFVGLVLVFVAGFALLLLNTQKKLGNDISQLTAQQIMDRLDRGPKVGTPLPDFSVQRIDGTIATLSDYKGKPTIVYFWATWCGTCRTSLSELKQVLPSYYGRVNFIGIDLDLEENMTNVASFVREQGYVGDYAIGNEKVLTDYYALMTSYKFASNKDLLLVDKNAGTYYAQDWRDAINKILQ